MPGGPELTELGARKALWDQLVGVLMDEFKLVPEWKSSSGKWSMRLKRGKRNIVYLIPDTGGFRVSFALGGKAVEAARKALPQPVIALIDAAPRYPEGTGLRMDVNSAGDVPVVQTLVRIKLEN